MWIAYKVRTWESTKKHETAQSLDRFNVCVKTLTRFSDCIFYVSSDWIWCADSLSINQNCNNPVMLQCSFGSNCQHNNRNIFHSPASTDIAEVIHNIHNESLTSEEEARLIDFIRRRRRNLLSYIIHTMY